MPGTLQPAGEIGEEELHPETAAMLSGFMTALNAKLLKAQKKYGFSNDWKVDDWEAECRAELCKHVQKGDPLDVAAYAAFCWARGWATSCREGAAEGDGADSN